MSTAYEARDVYVVNLPELFLHFLTFTMNGSGPRSSSAASPHEVKAARARARATARAAKKAPAVGGKCLPFYQPLAVILTSHG